MQFTFLWINVFLFLTNASLFSQFIVTSPQTVVRIPGEESPL